MAGPRARVRNVVRKGETLSAKVHQTRKWKLASTAATAAAIDPLVAMIPLAVGTGRQIAATNQFERWKAATHARFVRAPKAAAAAGKMARSPEVARMFLATADEGLKRKRIRRRLHFPKESIAAATKRRLAGKFLVGRKW